MEFLFYHCLMKKKGVIIMFLNIEGYSPTMIQNMDLSDVTTEEINRCLKTYLDHYSSCLIN